MMTIALVLVWSLACFVAGAAWFHDYVMGSAYHAVRAASAVRDLEKTP